MGMHKKNGKYRILTFKPRGGFRILAKIGTVNSIFTLKIPYSLPSETFGPQLGTSLPVKLHRLYTTDICTLWLRAANYISVNFWLTGLLLLIHLLHKYDKPMYCIMAK
jgi:hypothetical protein